MSVVRGCGGMVVGALALLLLSTVVGAPVPRPTVLAVPSAGHPAPSGSVYNLTITSTGTYGYQPDTIANLPLDTVINVTFIDDTALQHSFNISSREGVEIVDYAHTSAAQLAQILFSTPALYATVVNTLGEESVGAFLSPATPGWYEFVCNITGHFQLGMFGYIAFGEGLPGNLTLPGGAGSGGPKGFPVADAAIVLAVVLLILVGLMLRLRRLARDRELEEADASSPVLPRSPPAP